MIIEFNSGKIYFIAELILGALIFLYPATRRKGFILRLTSVIALLVLIASFFPTFQRDLLNEFTGPLWQFVTFFVLFILMTVGMSFCFKLDRIPLFAMCAAGYAVQHISYQLGRIIGLFNPPQIFPETFLTVSRTYEILCVIVCYLSIFFTLGRYSQKYECWKNTDKRYPFVAFAILFVCVFITRFSRVGSWLISNSIYAITCCLLVLYILFLLHKMESLSREAIVLQQLRQSEKKQYDLSRRTTDMINTKYHDLKHILAMGGVTNEMKEQIEKDVEGYEMFLHTGNEVLDIILTEKLLSCQDQGIRLTFMGNGKDLSFMKTMDLYSLFGNAVENAIEAVSKLVEQEKKTIGISLAKRGGMIIVSVVNYFDGTLVREDGDLFTLKKYEDGYHGFGMKSMKLIAEKYKGDLSYSVKDELFTLNVYLMDPTKI